MNARRLIPILELPAFLAVLYFFYLIYVPLVGPFQAVLAPVLLAATVCAAASVEGGALFFLLAFPLVNGLPYFFGIHEHIPHAPTALVLFLAFLLGRLIRRALGAGEAPRPMGRPRFMALAAGLVAVSAVLTVLRFYNFPPFFARGVYDLVTNVAGVSAGGARMSVIFSALNYICGFAWFAAAAPLFRSRAFGEKAVTALSLSFAVASLFGLVQHFADPSLGNTPFWVRMGQINGTFKDPNAFGAVLAMGLPFLLGAAAGSGGGRRLRLLACSLPGWLVFPLIGARSALLGLAAGLLVLAVPFLLMSKDPRRRRIAWAAGGILLAFGIAAGTGALGRIRLAERVAGNLRTLVSGGGLVDLSPERYFLWREAAAMARDYPVTGVGPGAFIVELPNYYSRDPAPRLPGLEGFRRNDSAENFFLQAAAELGLVGTIVFIGLFLSTARRAIRGVRRRAGPPDGFLLGAAAGMTAYLMNILFHSYIGSFETVFMFWTLSAVVFGRTDSEAPEPGPPAKSARIRRPAAAALLVGFGAVHLWTATHSLSLESRAEKYGFKQDFGFYAPERTADGRDFRWTGKRAGLELRIEKTRLEVPLLVSHPDISERPVGVRVFLARRLFREKRLLGELALSAPDWRTREFVLAPEDVGRTALLLFEVDRTWVPKEALGVPDPRSLGVGVGTPRFRDPEPAAGGLARGKILDTRPGSD